MSSYKDITLCSIYQQPNKRNNENNLNNLLTQLTASYIVAGDFNDHNIIWDFDEINHRGTQNENIINFNDLAVMNEANAKTYLHPAIRSLSYLDLSRYGPTLLTDFI